MDLSALYGVPVFFLMGIVFFACFSVLGYWLTRKHVERWLGKPPVQNEVISYYITARVKYMISHLD